MTPIPQSPWTLAIAELLGLRLAALDSGPQSADLLANLLPNRDPLPDGWLENFLAGTPVPGYPQPSPNEDVRTPATPAVDSFLDCLASSSNGGSLPNESAAGSSPLESLVDMAQSGSAPIPPTNQSGPSPANAPTRTGWEEAKRILKAGGSTVNISGVLNALYPEGIPNGPRGPAQATGATDPRAAGTPPYVPSFAKRCAEPPPGPNARTAEKASANPGAIQITVQFDVRKLVAELKLLARLEAERIVDTREHMYATQLKGSGRWR